MKPEIVKVQISLLGVEGPEVLEVSNEDDSIHWVGAPGEDVEKLLRGRRRAYFYARVENRNLSLGHEAPDQKW